VENFITLEAKQEEVVISGRIMAIRGQGAISFVEFSHKKSITSIIPIIYY
jgi:lysyl-tRNA synthetase class II